jgi:hypothetical protein
MQAKWAPLYKDFNTQMIHIVQAGEVILNLSWRPSNELQIQYLLFIISAIHNLCPLISETWLRLMLGYSGKSCSKSVSEHYGQRVYLTDTYICFIYLLELFLFHYNSITEPLKTENNILSLSKFPHWWFLVTPNNIRLIASKSPASGFMTCDCVITAPYTVMSVCGDFCTFVQRDNERSDNTGRETHRIHVTTWKKMRVTSLGRPSGRWTLMKGPPKASDTEHRGNMGQMPSPVWPSW